MKQRVIYEYPLNERVRSMLRLEFLFAQFASAAAGTSEWDARFALQSLFQVQELCGRKELRGELGRELRQQAESLNRHRHHAGVNPAALEATLTEVRNAGALLQETPDSERQQQQHEWLNAVRQRITIPGGTCQFDLPALHHWLQLTTEQRAGQLDDWLQPLAPVHQAVKLILELLRASEVPRPQLAAQGFFQHHLEDAPAPTQLIRTVLDAELGLFPEFSGNRLRYSIRFMSQPDLSQRPTQTDRDVEFRMACCGL